MIKGNRVAVCYDIMRFVAAFFVAFALSGCFTGIEGTPKIGTRELLRQNVVTTLEDTLLNCAGPQPLSEWSLGKLFQVTDDRINLALEPSGDVAPPRSGDTLSFVGKQPVASLTDRMDTELAFTDRAGHRYTYRINAPVEELDLRNRIIVPFTIELSMVDSVRKVLLSNTYYIRTSVWFDKHGNAESGLRYVPVTISDVQPGNMVYPARLQFVTGGAAVPDTAWVYLSVGDMSRNSRSFGSLFSVTDPRRKYPAIADSTWTNIVHGKVARYMTQEECRLAIGQPASIDRFQGTNVYTERWVYENGRYLIFEDGILKSYRM